MGAVSRLARRGGGTTLPGKLLWKADPGAIDRLAARLPLGSALVSATNGKTTATAMAAEILAAARPARPQQLGREPRLGRRLHPPLGPRRAARAVRGRRGRAAEVARRVRPRAIVLGNLFRDQLDRYGELELIAERWRDALAALPDTLLVVNADDPLLGELARGARPSGC